MCVPSQKAAKTILFQSAFVCYWCQAARLVYWSLVVMHRGVASNCLSTAITMSHEPWVGHNRTDLLR